MMTNFKQYDIILLNNGIYGFIDNIDTKNNIVYLTINPISSQTSKCYISDIKEIIKSD
jgi:preprotein translocase subunit YajC